MSRRSFRRETASGRRQAPRTVASLLESARALGIRDAQAVDLFGVTSAAAQAIAQAMAAVGLLGAA